MEELRRLLGQCPSLVSAVQAVEALAGQVKAFSDEQALLLAQRTTAAEQRAQLTAAVREASQFAQDAARLQGKSDLLHAQREALRAHSPTLDPANQRDIALTALDAIRPQVDEMVAHNQSTVLHEVQVLRDLEQTLTAIAQQHQLGNAAPAALVTAAHDGFVQLDILHQQHKHLPHLEQLLASMAEKLPLTIEARRTDQTTNQSTTTTTTTTKQPSRCAGTSM